MVTMTQGRINESTKLHILSLAVLLAATLVVYASTIRHAFVVNLDDGVYVVRNGIIRGFTWDHVRVALTRPYFGNYAPLHIFSYMLDYTLWGLKPAGYLLANVLLHYLNGVLVYLLLFRISGRKRWGFIGAFIFLLHPVQVESVAWVSQRERTSWRCSSSWRPSIFIYLIAPGGKTGRPGLWAVGYLFCPFSFIKIGDRDTAPCSFPL